MIMTFDTRYKHVNNFFAYLIEQTHSNTETGRLFKTLYFLGLFIKIALNQSQSRKMSDQHFCL